MAVVLQAVASTADAALMVQLQKLACQLRYPTLTKASSSSLQGYKMSAEWQMRGYSWESAWVLPYVPEACLLFSFFFLAFMLSCPGKCMMHLGVCEGIAGLTNRDP